MSSLFAAPLNVALPIADRRRSWVFYREGLGLEPVGEPAEDGIPEPLQFAVNDGVRVMFVPADGFGWVIGGRAVAEAGVSECVLTLSGGSSADVDHMITRAVEAGAAVVTAPERQPWGYSGAFADPDGHVWMVTAQP